MATFFFDDLLNEQKTRKNHNDSISSKAGYTHEGWILDV